MKGQIYVIGDSHIGLADGHETAINAWLDRLVALKPKALYLNGDLFHYLIAHPKFKTSSVEKVMAKFREVVVKLGYRFSHHSQHRLGIFCDLSDGHKKSVHNA